MKRYQNWQAKAFQIIGNIKDATNTLICCILWMFLYSRSLRV